MSAALVEHLLVLGLGGVVGLALGLTGAGGSILAVPLLVYGIGLPPASAIAISLIGVALTAAVGAFESWRHGLIVWQPSLIFAGGGIFGAPLGAIFAHHLPESGLVGGFAVLALVVGTVMWRVASSRPSQADAVRARAYGHGDGPICVLAPDGQLRFSTPCAIALAAIGLGTGFLSGLFGVGGGFVIVPALVFVTRMGVHRAVATSLLVIGIVGVAGAAGAILQRGAPLNVLIPFVLGGALAMMGARRLARRFAGPKLQRMFSACVIAIGFLMLLESVI